MKVYVELDIFGTPDYSTVRRVISDVINEHAMSDGCFIMEFSISSEGGPTHPIPTRTMFKTPK